MSTEDGCLLVLVEHGFLFYVSSTVNFEKLPADAKDVKNQDDQTRHPEDLTQAARQRKELKKDLGWHDPSDIIIQRQNIAKRTMDPMRAECFCQSNY